MRHAGLDLDLQIDVPPDFHGTFGGTDLLGPVPQFERRSDSDAGDPCLCCLVHLLFHLGDAVANEGQQMVGMRIAVGLVPLLANLAGEIHQHEIGAAAADLHAEGKDGQRIDEHRYGGLPDPTSDRLSADQKFVALQRAHDDGDGLGGKPCQAGDVRLRASGILTDERQHQPLVVGAHAHLVRAATGAHPGRWFRQSYMIIL